MRLGGRWGCAAHFTTGMLRAEGVILDHTIWRATHFNVPIVTADFLMPVLRGAWREWAPTTADSHSMDYKVMCWSSPMWKCSLSVSLFPPMYIFLSALIPSWCRGTYFQGRGSGAPVHQEEAELDCKNRVGGANVILVGQLGDICGLFGCGWG